MKELSTSDPKWQKVLRPTTQATSRKCQKLSLASSTVQEYGWGGGYAAQNPINIEMHQTTVTLVTLLGQHQLTTYASPSGNKNMKIIIFDLNKSQQGYETQASFYSTCRCFTFHVILSCF